MFNSKRKCRGDVIVNLIVTFVFVTSLLIAGGYAMGWIHFTSDSEKATIHIETQEIKDATSNAASDLNREVKELGDEAGKALEQAGESLQEKSDPPVTPEVNSDAI